VDEDDKDDDDDEGGDDDEKEEEEEEDDDDDDDDDEGSVILGSEILELLVTITLEDDFVISVKSVCSALGKQDNEFVVVDE
jgi:hypothetical protein